MELQLQMREREKTERSRGPADGAIARHAYRGGQEEGGGGRREGPLKWSQTSATRPCQCVPGIFNLAPRRVSSTREGLVPIETTYYV